MAERDESCVDLRSPFLEDDLTESAKDDGSGETVPAVPGAVDRHDAALLRLCRVMTAATVKAGNERRPSLSAAQVRTLTVLAASDGGLSLTAVAQCLGSSASAASRVCSRLVRDKLVDRRSGPGNEIRLSLSTQGVTILAEVNRARLGFLAPIVAHIEDADREAVWAVLERLAGAVGAADTSW